MKSLKFSLLSLVSIFSLGAFSQTQHYSYDPSGNRILRYQIQAPSGMVVQNNDTLVTLVFVNEELNIPINSNASVQDSLAPANTNIIPVNTADIDTSQTKMALESEGIKAVLFPNPATHTVTIIADEVLHNGTIYLYNDLGELLKEQPYTTSNALWVHHLARGNYFVRLCEGEKCYIWKLIKI